jgi:bifunctional non-homologous end joining protein LigD
MMKISPMLAYLVYKPFDGKGWIFEIKWDGYRALAEKKRDVKLISRGGESFNAHYPNIAEELRKIKGNFLVDGEIAILDDKGRSHFQLLQNYRRNKEGTPNYYVFDILSHQGKDLTHLPLIQRKEILKKLLKSSKLSYIHYSDHVEDKGIAFFRKAKKLGLEGIMAKRADSPYQFRRSRDWLKIKTVHRQEFVIGGFTKPRGGRKFFGSLLIGVYKNNALQYVGHVGGGFNAQLLEDVYKKLKPLICKQCPFATQPDSNTPATWVKPSLVCEVSFAEWTKDGILRQPIFRGMRTDKKARKVTRENPL